MLTQIQVSYFWLEVRKYTGWSDLAWPRSASSKRPAERGIFIKRVENTEKHIFRGRLKLRVNLSTLLDVDEKD
ncbi:MAG TPA: hypothetical protein DGB85_09115 [Deltaproteobacteria bacterium]|nr:hypothetical protein [Deltaproteobacteria bacterium]